MLLRDCRPYLYLAENVDAGQAKGNIGTLQPEIHKKWVTLTEEEKLDATAEALEELQARRDNSDFKTRNVLLAAFQDNRNTLDYASSEVRDSSHSTCHFSVYFIVVETQIPWWHGHNHAQRTQLNGRL